MGDNEIGAPPRLRPAVRTGSSDLGPRELDLPLDHVRAVRLGDGERRRRETGSVVRI